MDMKETEVKAMSAREAVSDLLQELESAGQGADTIAEHFERMRDRVENDDSRENYYMMGFEAGFKLARRIEADYHFMAIINSSRKVNGES